MWNPVRIATIAYSVINIVMSPIIFMIYDISLALILLGSGVVLLANEVKNWE